MAIRSFFPSTGLRILLGIASLSASSLLPPLPSAQAASRLGDLTPFRSITVDVSTLVSAGDLKGAKTRIKDLETSWDEAEAGLKPRDAKDWHRIDKAIDRALSAVRADPPDQKACETALASLLSIMDKVSAG